MSWKQMALCVMLALAIPHSVAVGKGASYVDQVKGTLVFSSPLDWVGSEPPMNQSGELLTALAAFEGSGTPAGLAALEQFLSKYPDSPWAPSIWMNLAEYYREHGRYSLALDHWEKAWAATKSSLERPAQQIAVRSVAGWTRLLASLGEKEKVQSLFDELNRLKLPQGTYSIKIEGTMEGVAKMNSMPGASFRCGSYALGNLARALGLESTISSNLFQIDSPSNGFQMKQLLALARDNGVAVDAVRRPSGGEIIVPSVIHWKLNHYAAIVDQKGDLYKVIDPTFRGYVWMDADTINAEASGAFLTPKTKTPAQWARLSEAECANIIGKGYPNEIEDEEDAPPCDCPPCDDDDDDDPPAANEGPGDGSSTNNCSEAGMPVWRVSEPYITLWIDDTPLLYRQSNGKWMKLKLHYKHRGEDKGSAIGGFGPLWECNLLDFVQANTATPDALTDHAAGGGLRQYLTNGVLNYLTARFVAVKPTIAGGSSGGSGSGQIIAGDAHVMVSPSGASRYYQFKSPGGLGKINYFPTHWLDRYGRAKYFNYQSLGSMVRLTNVVDIDGKSFVFAYTNTVFTNLITSVTDPYNRSAHFKYDSLGRLTNIVDMIGMSSSFVYDSNNKITSMVTPYGTNSFQYYSGTSPDYDNSLRRSILITEPNGEKQLYSYCDNGPASTTCDGYYHYRNSFHWNRAQYSAISSTGKSYVLNMPDADYNLATVKHWFHGAGNENGMTVSDTLSSVAQAANANGERSYVCYGYPGAPVGSPFIGTQKKVTEIYTMFGPAITMERNSLGHPTTITYFNAGYSTTYSNTYASDNKTLLKVTGPRGEMVRGYGYDPVLTNLLVSVTNALNEVTRYTHAAGTLKVTSITFPSGLIRSNVYYTSGTYKGFLAAEIDVGIRTNTFGYLNGNLVAQTNELGLVTTYIYDNLNRLVSTSYPDNTTVSNVYNLLDLAADKDRLNQWTYYGHNRVRQLTSITNVAQQVTTLDYCSCGSPSEIIRWNGSSPVTTSYSYDMAGNVTNVLYADGYQINYLYNDYGLVERIMDGDGHYWWLEYQILSGRPTVYQARAGTDPYFLYCPILFTRTFDEYGRIIQTVDRNSVTVTNAYDFLNRVVERRTIGNGGYGPEMTGLESFIYGPAGLTNYTNPLGKNTRYVRDVAGRVLYETNANNEVLSFTYNPADELLTLKDGKNQTTRWNYDQYGRVTNKVDAASNLIFVYKYDPLDRLTNRWSAAKGNTAYKYDAIGNLTNVVYLSGTTPNISLRYDGLNRLTNMVDAVGTTVFSWTSGDQLLREDGPWANDEVTYNYANRVRNQMSVAQPGAADWVQSYGYDYNYMRLTNVMSPAGAFNYDYQGTTWDRAPFLHLPNIAGPYAAYIYNQFDGMARLSDTYIYKANVLNRHQYSYNEGNQRTQQVFTATANGEYAYMDYTYDNIGQLKTANGYDHTYDATNGTYYDVSRIQEQFGYGYDKAWNLQFRTNNALVQTFNVDNRNQLTTSTRTGTFTVAGTATEPRGNAYYGWAGVTNVTVSGTGLSSGAADLYADGTWARPGATLADGNNTYTATAQDTYGRTATDTVSVGHPATTTFVYDLNGNLLVNNTRVFDYDDENQLIRITEPGAWKSEFAYDGLMRRRIRREYSATGTTLTPMVSSVSLSPTVRNNFTGWVGYKFTVGNSPVLVSQLGRWVRSGNTGNHAVKLVDANGNDLAGGSATVVTAGATAGAFAYASLANPITLSANTTYILVSQEVSGGDQWYDYNGALTTTGAASIISTAHANNGSTYYAVTAGGSYGYGPVNLKYTDNSWTLTNEVHYVYDGRLVIQERNASNLPQVTYTRGTDLSETLEGAGGIGGLLARTDNNLLTASDPQANAYYHSDGNGNVTALINTNGTVVARYSYDPYGNILSMSGSLAEANLYRFSSKEIHVNSSLIYYLYRYYSPNLQRWINRDPLGDIGSLSLLLPEITPTVSGVLDKDEAFGTWTEINRNVLKAFNNNPVGEIDGFGLCDDSLDAAARSNPGELGKLAREAAQEGREYSRDQLRKQIAKEAEEKAAKEAAKQAARQAAKKASEKTAKAMARQIEKDLGPAARREFHDAEHLTDRTIDELRRDAMEVYKDYGGNCPAWMRP